MKNWEGLMVQFNWRTGIATGLVFLSGLGTGLLISSSRTVNGKNIVVAASWLPDFATITADDIKVVERALDQVPEGAMTDQTKVVGRNLILPIEAGEPIREDDLFPLTEYDKDLELLRFAFLPRLWSAPGMNELIMEDGQIYPSSNSIDEVEQRIREYVIDASLFKDAYEKLKILKDSFLEEHVFELEYRLGKIYKAHAYFSPSPNTGSPCAALIIPGTGHNASSGIFRRDSNTYYGNILEITKPSCDSFVFVKPNEDFLAIHNGEKKLSYDFLVPYLINHGGSYAAHYVINTLAISKYLKKEYDQVFVLGLSQGGQAAFLNALQSEPTAAVVSSGFSVLRRKLNWGTLVGIIIPGLYKDFSLEKIFSIVEKSPTHFLFTYGRNEFGTNKIEAEEECSCDFFEPLSNVTCLIHDRGHIFPETAVRDFIVSQLAVTR
ncbi:SAF domain-containing protein [Acidobacteria bacterium AH-259-G07]|nr:SAF domain-containing protein [Acidobacteria bacterium AH-259-G07]